MCYFVACLHALTLRSLKYLPLSPAVVLGLLHTFAVKIPPIRCFGPVVSSQAQQQGEDLKKKSYVHTLQTQPAIFTSFHLPSTAPASLFELSVNYISQCLQQSCFRKVKVKANLSGQSWAKAACTLIYYAVLPHYPFSKELRSHRINMVN